MTSGSPRQDQNECLRKTQKRLAQILCPTITSGDDDVVVAANMPVAVTVSMAIMPMQVTMANASAVSVMMVMMSMVHLLHQPVISLVQQ